MTLLQEKKYPQIEKLLSVKESRPGGIRNTLTVALVSIVITGPISLVVSFYVNHSLQAPRLQLAYVHPVAALVDHEIEPVVLSSVRTNRPALEAIRLLLAKWSLDDPCIAWLDGSPWSDTCYDKVAPKVKGRLSHAQTSVGLLGTNLNRLRAWTNMNETPQLEPMSDPPWLTSYNGPAWSNKGSAISAISSALDSFWQECVVLGPLVKEFQKIKETPQTRRTGNVRFHVGILNKGDSDAVLRQKGKLGFDGCTLELLSDAYTVIKGHSFAEVDFQVDKESSSDSKKRWEELVGKHTPQKFSISLPSPAGNSQIRIDGTLPP